MKSRVTTRSMRASAALLLVASGSLASAAELEEMVVTAQRREQDLQDVPVAVSALSGEQVVKQGIHDLTGIATRVPGLTFSPFSPGQNIVALRGVSSNDDGAGTDNSVAVFVDGVYLGRVSNINPELFDIERVEVLRGPQGTLYGRNTIGGAINIYSTKPNTRALDARLRANIGNYNLQEFTGLLSGPLSERWAAKISVSSRTRDGWVDNVVLHKEQKDDDAQAARAQLMFTGEDTESILTVDWNQLDVGDMGRIPLTQITGSLGPVVDSYRALCGNRRPKCSTNPSDGFAEREGRGISLSVTNSSLGPELTSITAYRDSDANWAMDSIGVNIPLTDRIDDETEQFSQELRLAGAVANWTYVVGAWYLRENTDRAELFDIGANGDFAASDRYRQDNETTSVALFGQADLAINDAWTLTLGARYSRDEKAIHNIASDGDFVIINQSFENRREEQWDAFTPKVSVTYQPVSYVNTYLSVAQGFKSGGFPAAPQREADSAPLDLEEAINYELGVKAEPTGSLRVNAALFYTEYTDLQIQSFGPLAGCVEDPTTPQLECFGAFQTFNAGDAEARGVELEAAWLVTDNLSIGASYGYLDTEFVDLIVPNSAYPNQSGQELIHAPKQKYNVTLDYRVPLESAGELNFNVDYRFTDDQRGELEPYAVQPSFDLLDARVSWLSGNDHWEVAAWVRNITDEEYVTHIYTVGSEVIGVFGDPRTYGVSFTWRN